MNLLTIETSQAQPYHNVCCIVKMLLTSKISKSKLWTLYSKYKIDETSDSDSSYWDDEEQKMESWILLT